MSWFDYVPIFAIVATILLAIANLFGLGLSWLIVIAPIALLLVVWFATILLWGMAIGIGWVISKF